MEELQARYYVNSTCPNPFDGGPSLSQVCTATNMTMVLTLLNTLIDVIPKIGDPCGRVNPREEALDAYDFVVIGVKCGAAGAAVAARLSEIAEWNVALFETGPDEPSGIEVPANYGVYLGTELDWKYETTNETHACLARNGKCKWPRGKNLGGTTAHHGMGYHRGHEKDYTRWVEWGNVGWSYEDVLPWFKKCEDNHEIDRVGSKYHATGGPMSVERFPWQPAIAQNILDAAVEVGYGYAEDLIGDKITGFTIAQTMSLNGVRQTSASAYLRPIRNRENLDIILNATATKILTDDKKVNGVEYYKDGEFRTVKVTREVVVSGGAVNSPQLLLLSGIGPAAELEEIGIPVVLDLPGVGKNLHNHVSYGMDFAVPITRRNHYDKADVESYLGNQTGPLSSTGLAQMTGVFASTYTTPDDPDIQMFFSGFQESCVFTTAVDAKIPKSIRDDEPVRFTAVNLHQRSRGQLSLASKDPFEHPTIWSNDLADPTDVEVILEGIHAIQKIVNSAAMQKTKIYNATECVEQCSEYECLSDDYFRCAARYDTRTENHQAGTCKMGPASDSMAVVDPQLRVHGIEGLRVADASIMPQMVSGNPHATITMIGERCADFIKKEHSTSTCNSTSSEN